LRHRRRPRSCLSVLFAGARISQAAAGYTCRVPSPAHNLPPFEVAIANGLCALLPLTGALACPWACVLADTIPSSQDSAACGASGQWVSSVRTTTSVTRAIPFVTKAVAPPNSLAFRWAVGGGRVSSEAGFTRRSQRRRSCLILDTWCLACLCCLRRNVGPSATYTQQQREEPLRHLQGLTRKIAGHRM
jgi:hypothetical protein